jgi:hypothetical protein
MTTQDEIREAIRNAQTLLQSLAGVDLETAPHVAAALADKFAQQAQVIVCSMDVNRFEVQAREVSRSIKARRTPTNFRRVGVK